MKRAVISLSEPVAEEETRPAPERLLAGQPLQSVANYYSDASQQFHVGRWRSTAGKWRVSYTEHEFCHLLGGRVRLYDAAGKVQEFGAGESFVVPAGFNGIFEVLEPCEKLYAIFDESTQSR
ncbi:MAG: cupin domain-containing protein [Steroidobacteraceae bacterium]